MDKTESIGALVRQYEDNWTSGTIHRSEFVDDSLYEDIQKIEAYLNSRHTSGEVDSQGREKPFANITIGHRNVWYRATDIDKKHLRIKATKSSDVLNQYVGTAHIQDWMRRENFGQFLNIWGLNLASYNYAWTKWVEQEGKLIPTNIPWTRIICDAIDPESNPKIEILELTPAQLRKRKGYDKKIVKELIEATETRKAQDGTEKDSKSDYIRIYEVHGEFSQAVLKASKGEKTTPKDEEIFFEQTHIISFVKGKEEGKYDDFTLYSGKSNDPYLLTWLIPSTDGSISLDGSVKNLFQAQWMLNHSVKAIKDQLDLASKILFQTSDPTFVGQNALFAMDVGDILIHSPNSPLTQVNNGSHDIGNLQAFYSQWKQLGNEINGISDAMLGAKPASGTAWRQTEALLQESHDLFELMIQNKKLHLETMLRRFIIPFVKKKMDTSEEIAVTLSDYGIEKIDSMYIKHKAFRKMMDKDIERVINGEEPLQDMNEAMTEVRDEMSLHGEQRFLKPSEVSDKTWKDSLKDFEWDAEVEIDGETGDVQEAMATINTLIKLLADPNVAPFFESDKGKFLLSKALQLTGQVSPLELSELKSIPAQVQPNMPMPNGGSVANNGGELAGLMK